LAVAFNSFYEHVKVLDSDNADLKSSRVCLVNSFNLTLEKALDLLGIDAPHRM
jgi:arginyl-tRNA synthetase